VRFVSQTSGRLRAARTIGSGGARRSDEGWHWSSQAGVLLECDTNPSKSPPVRPVPSARQASRRVGPEGATDCLDWYDRRTRVSAPCTVGTRPDTPSARPSPADEITRLLRESCEGIVSSRDSLLSAVHGELLGMARAQMRGERNDHTLGATALVHEAYLRLFRALSPDATVDWADRGAFYAAAATAMRRILVDHARTRARDKRGGSNAASRRVALDVLEAARSADPTTLVALDEAIERLATIDARAAEVVRLRFFAGLEQADIATLLGCTERTVKRDWAFARAWLHDALAADDPPPSA
jgi:RNA polymerase sigma factor (TIGR02999 family)